MITPIVRFIALVIAIGVGFIASPVNALAASDVNLELFRRR